jgi:threonylcarbamoyladenosine tRNA methylthiotransferase MtaB
VTAQACPQSSVAACAAPGSRVPDPGSRLSYSILTFGCRVNQADSFDIEAALRARGATEGTLATADLVVVNTCTVTSASDQGARQAVRRVARDNPRARILVTGCYATRQPDELASLPNVIRLVPNADKHALGPILDAALGLTVASGGEDLEGACGRLLEPGAMGRTAIPLRVQTGCGEPCSFCIIPSTRGASRSRPIQEVLEATRRLVESGYREIWLVGVHLGAYGRDVPDATSLVHLARALDAEPGDVTYRLSSLEPMDCPTALVDLVASSGRFAPHFHLPLQHGSDRILGLMRRPYTAAYFEALVGRIAARIPHVSIGSDVMVGFPGETDDDAHVMAERLERMRLSYLHVFPYSDRPGTEAAQMGPRVDGAAIRARAARLRAIGARHGARVAASQTGSVRPGLTIDDGTMVLTDNYLKVRIPPGLPRNVRVRARIDEAEPTLRGRVVATDT